MTCGCPPTSVSPPQPACWLACARLLGLSPLPAAVASQLLTARLCLSASLSLSLSVSGVTFSARPASRIYSPRNYFGAGIFTNSTASGNRGDVMFVMGGRVPPSAASPYGGVDLNDVWLTTNYGYAWVQVSASAPWSARDSLNVAVSNYGVIAVYGGSVYGGSAGWLDDTWVSLDGGYLWTQLAGSGQLNNRSQAAILFDALGYLNVWFGQEAPAYNWSTDGWKSAYSFNNIQQWGPLVNPSFSLTTLSPGYSACAPINYQGGTPGSSASSSSAGSGPTPSSSTASTSLSSSPVPSSAPPAATSSPSPAVSSSSGGGAATGSFASSSSSSLSGGAIAGIVIGSLVGVSLIVLLLLCFGRVALGGLKKEPNMNGSEPASGAGKFSYVDEDSQVGTEQTGHEETGSEVEMQ